jgi:hypothetical protein
MKSAVKPLCLLCVLCGAALCFSLDREAFSITTYDLSVQLDPEQHRLGARGKITLRNDAPTPQKIAVLQISSSLNWRSIKAGDKVVQFVTQPYTSDIDHTGALSEAIVTLPQAIASHATIELNIAYEGVIQLDATRLTRIGTPEDAAKSTDWDRIDPDFTAVRGVGYVAWYPIATDVANLSDGDTFEVLGRWKAREAESSMNLEFDSTKKCEILFSGDASLSTVVVDNPVAAVRVFNVQRLGINVPTFVLADYETLDVKGLYTVHFLPRREAIAKSYASLLKELDPFPKAGGSEGLQVLEVPSSVAAPFVTDGMLLMPFKAADEEDRRVMIYALARHRIRSVYPWITDGLGHLAQVLDAEQEHGRKAALDYLSSHQAVLAEFEKRPSPTDASASNESASHSLLGTTDDLYLQTKSMYVWSMLRDMMGDTRLNIDLFRYRDAKDDVSAMQKLIEKITQRDLEWFFDDWVYRDRGLPDFKVESAFSRKTLNNTFILSVTVDNLGSAGAEVPVIVKFAGGEATKRLEVRAKDKATIRIETPAAPQKVMVNDGSVPESDVTNNEFKVDANAAK